MRNGLPTCRHPEDPTKYYFRVMYREWFFGPFDSPIAVGEAMKKLDDEDFMWDYDCVATLRGANPLPSDYVGGFPVLTDSERAKVREARGDKGDECPAHVESAQKAFGKYLKCGRRAGHAGEHDYCIGTDRG